MAVYKREKLMFVHRSLGSTERKHRGENIILRGNILAVVANKLQEEGRRGGGRVTEVISKGDLAISVFHHFSPIHLLNWEPFKATHPQPMALGAEQG